MKEKFTPRPLQLVIARHIIEYPRCGVFSFMGSGKTTACLYAMQLLSLIEDDLKILVVAPKRVASFVWREEIEKWIDFEDMTISTIVGDAKERLRAIRKEATIYTINFENLPWLMETVGKHWPWTTVIVDESTRLKGFRIRKGAQRARALAKYTWTKIERFVELTGTPVTNGLLGLWPQLWFLDRGERLGSTYGMFKELYFRIPYPNAKYVIPMRGAEERIADKIKDICISIRAEDWMDVKAPIVQTVNAYLSPKEMDIYREFEKELFVELKANISIEALSAAVKSMKSLQIASGAAYIDDKQNFSIIHDAKLDAMDDIIDEFDEQPLLIVYHFKSSLIRLQKKYPKARVLRKDQDIVDWNKGKISMLFVHPASAGHGLSMQHGGNVIVFFDQWWDTELRHQVIERIGPVRQLQSGYNRPVYIYNIIAKDTIDEDVILKHESNKTTEEILLERSRRVL